MPPVNEFRCLEFDPFRLTDAIFSLETKYDVLVKLPTFVFNLESPAAPPMYAPMNIPSQLNDDVKDAACAGVSKIRLSIMLKREYFLLI